MRSVRLVKEATQSACNTICIH